MRRYTFYLSVALLAFGIGSFVVYFSFLKKENVSIEISMEVKSNAQNITQIDSDSLIEKAENPKDKFTCSDKTLLLVWNELKETEYFDEDWAEHLLAFGIDDCAKAYEVKKVTDLNADGKSEVIVQGNNLADCTVTGNCSFAVFEKRGQNFKFILKANEIQKFKVKKTETNGYKDIEVRTWNTGFEYYIQLFKYNSEDYQARKCWFETNQVKGRFLKKPKLTFVKCGEYEYVN